MTRFETSLPAPAAPDAPRPSARGDVRVLAQALGQSGARRGLRGGAPVLQAAREVYLRTEWAGAHDRRLPPGRLGAARI